MNLKPREVKTALVAREELLIALYNEQHDQLVRNQIDLRVAQRLLVSSVVNKNEMETGMVRAKKLIKVKQETCNVIMDELLELKKKQKDESHD